jgi:hypothetical protein
VYFFQHRKKSFKIVIRVSNIWAIIQFEQHWKLSVQVTCATAYLQGILAVAWFTIQTCFPMCEALREENITFWCTFFNCHHKTCSYYSWYYLSIWDEKNSLSRVLLYWHAFLRIWKQIIWNFIKIRIKSYS